jgi:hypothetical protein
MRRDKWDKVLSIFLKLSYQFVKKVYFDELDRFDLKSLRGASKYSYFHT